MALVAVTGDAATTTAVALVAGWPVDRPVVLLEADPSGGDLAAWFDVPSEPGLTDCVARFATGGEPDFDRVVRTSPGGLRFLPVAPRAVEAGRAVVESGRGLVGRLARPGAETTVADIGGLDDRTPIHPFVPAAAVIVAVHRQAQQSAAAAAVRLRRFADDVASLGRHTKAQRVVAIVGGRPFGPDEIRRMFTDGGDDVPVITLPDDPFTAAVFAGRPGVSPRRLARLPLARAGADLARLLATDFVPRSGPSDVPHGAGGTER